MNSLARILRTLSGQKTVGGRRTSPIDEMDGLLSRRDLLGATGTALAVSIAGCMGPGGSSGGFQGGAELPPATLRMESIDDPELPTKVLYTVGFENPGRRAELMDDILEGGTTVEDTRPPIPEDRHIYYDDVVYRLSHEIIEKIPATRYQIRVDIVQGTVVEGEAVQFSELPAVDRAKFAERGWDDGGSFGLGTTLLYTHPERNKSALVPESEYSYIVWEDGSEAAWFVDGSHETTLNTYEYSAERYSTAAEYGQRMRDRSAFELAGLPEVEATIVQTAIDEGRFVVEHEETPTSAFWSLVDRFEGQEQAHGIEEDGEGDLNGSYLVQYDGEFYWTVLLINAERTETDAPS